MWSTYVLIGTLQNEFWLCFSEIQTTNDCEIPKYTTIRVWVYCNIPGQNLGNLRAESMSYSSLKYQHLAKFIASTWPSTDIFLNKRMERYI